MSGNLTALVQNLCAISRGTDAPAAEGAYGEALRQAWGGDHQKAAQGASALLAGDPESSQRFAAYRLWIEALAEAKDHESLAALRDHLFLRGQADPGDHETYAALRGVAHFELDELGAARLLARSMTDATDNSYCLELVQMVNGRDAGYTAPALLDATAPLADFFHWQTLCRGLLAGKHEEPLNEALAYVREQYRGATLPHLFEYHRCIDQSFFAGAALVAQRLVELFPTNVDYRYYQAFALFEDGDYPSSRKILNETLRLCGDRDAEVVGLLGHCNAKLGDAEKAVTYLRRAVELLAEEGLPTSHISLELANVEDELRGDKVDPATELPRLSRNWLVHLSPRRYHELQTSSENAVDRLLRPMGEEPRPGDYCFFASTTPADEHGRSQWRIVAIYAVDSEPMWHPTHHWHSALKLVKRLTDGIPVDVQTMDDEQTRSALAVMAPKGDPLRYGVYELDMGALDIIEQAARLQRDDMIERRRSGAQSRRPTA